MLRWLAHVLGIDTQQSYWYDAWSGCIPALITSIPIWISSIVFVRHKNCQTAGCWRIRSHDGTPYCTKHHPDR